MKKIDFGYDNSIDPKGSHEGIGIVPGTFLLEGEYIGSMEYDGNFYIVARVLDYVNEKYKSDSIIVRDAIVDLYVDGSGCMLLDQEQSMEASMFENYLNRSDVRGKISNIQDVYNNLSGVHMTNNAFLMQEMHNQIISSSILHEIFEKKKNILKNCHRSFSGMQETIIELENQNMMNR